MRKQRAKGAKRTFWNEKRVSQNILVQELADTLGVAVGTIGNWLSGAKIPPENRVRELCDLFGVGYDEGYNEFVRANRIWDSERGKLSYDMVSPTSREVPSTERKKKTATESVADDEVILVGEVAVETKDIHINPVEVNKPDIIKYLYGRLLFDDYEDFKAEFLKGADPLRLTYGKLSYDDYKEFEKIVNA